MDYRTYTAEDFALDEKFQKWVLDPSAEVTVFWEQWLKENPQQHQQINNAIELVRVAGLSSDSKLNEAYLSVWKKIHDHTLQTKEVSQNTRFRYMKVAAAFIGLVVSSFLVWNQFKTESVIEYRTTFGEIKEFVLEDGSKVTLNSNSLLKFTGGWKDQVSREVFLEGEAFFEIVKTKDQKRFGVNTEDQVHIQVMGTEFNVNTRRQKVEVYLQSGKVKVNSLAGEVTLKPGDFIVCQKDDKSLEVKQNGLTENKDVLDWKSNNYIFNDTPLSEIVSTLEDDYGFIVIIQDKELSQKKITAKISRKDSSVLLRVLSETLDIKIEQDGNHLTFTD